MTCNLQVRAADLPGLLLLYSSSGHAEGMDKLAELAKKKGKLNISFIASFLRGNVADGSATNDLLAACTLLTGGMRTTYWLHAHYRQRRRLPRLAPRREPRPRGRLHGAHLRALGHLHDGGRVARAAARGQPKGRSTRAGSK